MALGNQNGLYRLIAGHVDVVAEFRVPARYLLLACFPLAAAAALGTEGTDVLLYGHLGRFRRRVRQGLGVVGVVLRHHRLGPADQRGRTPGGGRPGRLPPRMRRYYRESWPRRLAARPAWEYATNAETISGRDGGLLPLRTYQEFFTAAVNPAGRLTAGVTTQAPSKWGWPALDLLGVRWFVTGGLPRPRSR